MAAKEGFEQVVALLLDRGADVNFLDHVRPLIIYFLSYSYKMQHLCWFFCGLGKKFRIDFGRDTRAY